VARDTKNVNINLIILITILIFKALYMFQFNAYKRFLIKRDAIFSCYEATENAKPADNVASDISGGNRDAIV